MSLSLSSSPITDETLGLKAKEIVRSTNWHFLEKEVRVVRIKAGIIRDRRAGVVGDKRANVVKVIVNTSKNIVRAGIGVDIVRASINIVKVGKVVVRMSVVMVGVRIWRKSWQMQISLIRLRWTLILWNFLLKRFWLGIKISLHNWHSCGVKNSKCKWKILSSINYLIAWVLAKSRLVFKSRTLCQFLILAISLNNYLTKSWYHIYFSASMPYLWLIQDKASL